VSPPIEASIDYDMLPEHLREGMRRYVEQCIETGGFLRAVLENDFEQAILRADVHAYLGFVWIARFLQQLPPDAWGSRLILQTWIEKHAPERSKP
jgi:hypothetical protein